MVIWSTSRGRLDRVSFGPLDGTGRDTGRMAERLAPEQVPLRVTSRPERRRGRFRRWFARGIGLLVALVVLLAGALVTLQLLAVERGATPIRATALIPEGAQAKALVVLARPGQELTMAGTLADLHAAGAHVDVLSITAGEAQPPAVSFAAENLATVRTDELANAADLLGVDSASVAGFGDGSLLSVDPDKVTVAIGDAIAKSSPSVVLTVSDQTGEDGDSMAVAGYVLAAAEADGSGVARVWTVTRGDRELSWNAELGHPVASSVPDAQVAVTIDDQTTTKGEALRAYGTRSPDLAQATYPLADTIPAWAYFRFWDREYFSLAWGTPLA